MQQTVPLVRILVVDDEPGLRTMLERGLPLLGLEVLIASGGPEAIRTYKENPGDIDVLLSDIMPKMSGIGMVKHVQKIAPRLRFCFMTSKQKCIWTFSWGRPRCFPSHCHSLKQHRN